MDRLKDLNLLFLEDNSEFAQNTSEFLKIHFNKIFCCSDIKDAIDTYKDNRIDVIMSDIKLNHESGLDFIKYIRDSDESIPIVVLSAHKDEEFLFEAITLNITSYELKPLRYDDFIKILDKISSKFNPQRYIQLGDGIIYSFKSKELTLDNTPVSLTKREIMFLELLIKNGTKITDHSTIQRDVWENNVMSDAAIKNLILRLRKKISPEFISSVKGIGYKLGVPISS